eukprot:6213960-Pleurochrysis_carterae.AAC.2
MHSASKILHCASLLNVLTRWALSVNQAGVVVDLRSVLFGRKQSATLSMWSSCDGVRQRVCIANARDLEADELVDTSGDLAFEALAVGCCKLVEEAFVLLVGVGDMARSSIQTMTRRNERRLRVTMHVFPQDCMKP